MNRAVKDRPITRARVKSVYQAIESEILSGQIRPRDRLIEDELMQRFGAKRHVVRQALGELERMGIVERVRNRGAMVRDFDAAEIKEISEIRMILQRHAALRMQLPVDPSLIEALETAQRRHDDAIAAGDPRQIDQANEGFHQLFFASCGNSHLAEAIARYAYLARAMRLHPMADATLLRVFQSEHWAMIEALKAGDRAVLADLVAGHLQHAGKIHATSPATNDLA